MYIERADYDTLSQIGLLSEDTPSDARLMIFFDDGRILAFKPHHRYHKKCYLETELILDIDGTDDELVDEIVFSERNLWNLDEILAIIDRDAYRRLSRIHLELSIDHDLGNITVATVGSSLYAWYGTLFDSGSSGTTLRSGRLVAEIHVVTVKNPPTP